MRVGSVQRAHATQGEIFVDPEYFGSVTGDAVMSAASKEAARTAIDLGNVDNTSDANKPVSTATQAALTTETDTRALATRRFRQIQRDALADAFAPPRPADVPVITIATGGTTISGGVLVREKRVGDVSTAALDILGDTHFRYKGIPSAADAYSAGNFVAPPYKPGGDAQFATWMWNIDFDTAAPEVEFRLRGVTANAPCGIYINGRWLSELAIPRATPSGTSYNMKLTFSAAETRRIEVRFVGQEGFGGVWTTPNYTIVKPAQAIRRRIAIIGDSVTNSSGSAPTGASQWETYALRLGYLMGGDDIIFAGIGGTGYVAGTATGSTFADRIPTILAMPYGPPDVVVLVGSQNDSAPTAGR